MASHSTFLLLLAALTVIHSVTPLSVPFRRLKAFYRPESDVEADPGNPVYLTPYIKAGQLDQGICTAAVFSSCADSLNFACICA